MSRKRFFTIRTHIHFVNNLDVSREVMDSNKFWKVQPVLDAVKNQCLKIERSATDHYSLDEQMIPFMGKCGQRQFVKNKPRPVGLKNFVLTTSDGIMLDFVIYQGSTTDLPDRDLGLGAAVTLKLTETLPRNSHVYFDRYFTSLPGLIKLSENGIYGSGTLMTNRFRERNALKEDRHMNRGDSQQIVGFKENKPTIAITKWMDNKSVLLASTSIGKESSTMGQICNSIQGCEMSSSC